jgi:hypothetical protein
LSTTYTISAFIQETSNSGLVEVYSIQHYVIKFVSDLLETDGFLWVLLLLPPIKSDSHDITEISLKVALKTTTQTYANE